MQRLRNISLLALITFGIVACTDSANRLPTQPDGARLSFTLGDPYKSNLEAAIRAGIVCLLDPKQEANRLKDFTAIVGKADKGDVQAVEDFVNNFVKWADGLIAKKNAPDPIPEECGGRTLSLQVAAQELYNLLLLYAGLYDQITGAPGGEFNATACIPGVNCELKNEDDGVFIVAPADAFNFPVILFYTPTEVDPADFSDFGTVIPPAWEIGWFPYSEANVAVNRYWCVSLADAENPEGVLQGFHLVDGVPEAIPFGDDHNDCAALFYAQISNPLLRGAYRLASWIAPALAPKPLYALRHAAIGGPATTASPHVGVRRPDPEVDEECAVPTGFTPVNAAGTYDIRVEAPIGFTSLVSITLNFEFASAGSHTVNVRAFRPNGNHDLGTVTREFSAESAGDVASLNFLWPTQPIAPNNELWFDVSTSGPGGVQLGITDTEAACIFKTFAPVGDPAQVEKVAGTYEGHAKQ